MRRNTLPFGILAAIVLVGAVGAGGAVTLTRADGPPRAPAPAPSASPTAARVLVAVPAPSVRPTPKPRPSPSGATAARAAAPTGAPTAAPAPPPRARSTLATGWRAYAGAGPVTLRFPVDVVELVGLHESAHDGAQQQQPERGAGRIGLLDSRERGTLAQGAADIVVRPGRQVRSPVTGRVVRAGTYTLYCDHADHFLVIEPDARPGWEVKVLHFEGLAVRKGDRVQAGVTVVGARARVLPFASQVDKYTAVPHWPHLHIEVVDPTIPDRPSDRVCD